MGELFGRGQQGTPDALGQFIRVHIHHDLRGVGIGDQWHAHLGAADQPWPRHRKLTAS